jgi:alpha-D-ribose 1-methylphosphonate 5-triphosphate synthase subunit PhnG
MGETGMKTRADWLAVLARCPEAAMETTLEGIDCSDAEWLRPAQTGMIMLEGRAGGGGQRFSLGQATVTRATCFFAGATGVGYVMGHFPRRAELMALCDALLQGDRGADLYQRLIAPQSAAQAAGREDRARAAAATKVEFFTMSRESAAGAS